VNRRVAAAPSLEALLDFLLDRTASVCPTDRISMAFIEPGDRVISNCARANYTPLRLVPGYSEGLAGSSLEQVVRTGRTRIIPDLNRYALRHPASRSTQLILAEGLRSSMTCPLTVDGRHVGLLWRSSKRPHAYSEHHVELHLAIAERLAQTTEKAYRLAQLEAANRAYAEMLGFISHELKAPVASMLTDINLILGGYLGAVDARQRSKLENSVGKGNALLGLVRDYLDLSRIDGGGLSLKPRPLDDFAAEVLQPAIEMTADGLAGRGLSLQRHVPESPLGAECDPELMRIVAVNYLSNAVKYGAAGGAVDVRLWTEEARLKLTVRNTGPGFRAEDRGRLFRRFSRLSASGTSRIPGTGLGLYTCARVAELHGGRVWADSVPGQWAEFGIEIPLSRKTGS
jgi:hypothetical protein